MTMNQPTAPCSPPRTNKAASRQAIALGNRALQREPGDADEEDEAEDAAEQAMDPFPEEDELEAGQRHSGGPGDLAILRRLLVEVEGVAASRLRSAAGSRR